MRGVAGTGAAGRPRPEPRQRLNLSRLASAHCDTLDGRVVQAALQALEAGNADPVLIWVQKDQARHHAAFDSTRQIRKLSPAARELGHRRFFEYIHCIEGLYEASEKTAPHAHAAENEGHAH